MDGDGHKTHDLVLTLSPDLKAALETAAESEGRSPSDVISDLIERYLAAPEGRAASHEAWFRAEVAKALSDTADGIAHDVVMNEARRRTMPPHETDRACG